MKPALKPIEGKKERIFLSPPHLTGREQQLVAEAFASNYVAPVGPMLTEFEKELAVTTGFNHCVAVASGTAALHLILRCLGVSAGDRVYVSDFTFIASVTPILFQNAEPVLIDCDRTSWTMDPQLLKDALVKADKNGQLPKAVIPTDIYGQSCDLDAILEVCSRYDIPVVCDSAEALGTRYKDRHAGKGAIAAALSFNGNKIITTSGGGAVVTDDKILAEKVSYYSTQARDPVIHYEHADYGYNYRMSNILAAIGRGQLSTLKERVEHRRRIFDRYREKLADVPGLSFMPEPSWGVSTHWLSCLLIDPTAFGKDREAVRLALEDDMIESRPLWKPMHLQPVFAKTPCIGGAVAEALFSKGLCLPSGSGLSEADQERVIMKILALCS